MLESKCCKKPLFHHNILDDIDGLSFFQTFLLFDNHSFALTTYNQLSLYNSKRLVQYAVGLIITYSNIVTNHNVFTIKLSSRYIPLELSIYRQYRFI